MSETTHIVVFCVVLVICGLCDLTKLHSVELAAKLDKYVACPLVYIYAVGCLIAYCYRN